ncbi:dienelactone hydrolase family protein [Aliidiomarina sp. Khilg15.8]
MRKKTSLLPWATAAGLALSLLMPAQAAIVKEHHDYDIDGTTYRGYVAYNDALETTRGTVVIVHDWDGPNAYEEFRAEQLAGMGYTAFAIDVYGKDRQPASMEENRARTSELYADREAFRARLMGSIDEVSAIPGGTDNIVVMGYCFGGAAVLELARAGADIEGFVSFHGGLNLPDGQNYNDVKAPVLLLHGSADPVSGMDDLAALLDDLQAAGVEHNAEVYGGARHSFSVHSSGDYDIKADQASWAALQDFLQQRLN